MTRLHTQNRRKLRKLFGRKLPSADAKRLALVNRYVASPAHSSSYATKYWFRKDRFYRLKDRMMDQFGRHVGYALQVWRSWGYDGFSDYEGEKDACGHEHILEIVRIGGMELHRPTGHFSFYNSLNGYSKESAGFDDWRAKCTQRIGGVKKVTANYPDSPTAFAALLHLEKRYGHLLTMPAPTKPLPRVKVSEPDDEVTDFNHRGIYRRSVFPSSPDILCVWCGQSRPLGQHISDRPFCAACAKIVSVPPKSWLNQKLQQL